MKKNITLILKNDSISSFTYKNFIIEKGEFLNHPEIRSFYERDLIKEILIDDWS